MFNDYVAHKGLLSLFIGFILMLLVAYPVWAFLYLPLLLVFVGMSILCLMYLLFVIIAFFTSYWRVRGNKLFMELSIAFIVCITLLSSFCCLYAIDPTNFKFLYFLAVALILFISSAILIKALYRKNAGILKLTPKASDILTIVLAALVAITRFSMFYFDNTVAYIAYCASIVLLLIGLIFGYHSYKEDN
jgi:hypothetical protein